GDPRNGVFMGPVGNGRSGDDGRFAIENVVAGTYRASASVPIVMSGPGGGGFVSWTSGSTAGGVIASPAGGSGGRGGGACSGRGEDGWPGADGTVNGNRRHRQRYRRRPDRHAPAVTTERFQPCHSARDPCCPVINRTRRCSVRYAQAHSLITAARLRNPISQK